MLFSEPHTATFLVVTKDAYQSIVSTQEINFSCFLERRTRYGYNDNQMIEVGKGIIYTSTDTLAFDTGEKVKIDNEYYIIKACHRACGIDGEFSHWELTYG